MQDFALILLGYLWFLDYLSLQLSGCSSVESAPSFRWPWTLLKLCCNRPRLLRSSHDALGVSPSLSSLVLHHSYNLCLTKCSLMGGSSNCYFLLWFGANEKSADCDFKNVALISVWIHNVVARCTQKLFCGQVWLPSFVMVSYIKSRKIIPSASFTF